MSLRLIYVSLITKINRLCKFPSPTVYTRHLENAKFNFSKNVHSDSARQSIVSQQKTVQTFEAPVHIVGIPFTTTVTSRALPVSQSRRSKHTKSKKPSQDEDEDDDYFETAQGEESGTGKQTSVYVTSLRIDAVLKAGLGLSRNKVEEYFYQSRVRVNDEKLMKKSVSVSLGDVVDIVRGFNSSSDRYIDVMRLHIVGIKVPNDSQSRLELKVKRDKLLTIENYAKEWSGEDISS